MNHKQSILAVLGIMIGLSGCLDTLQAAATDGIFADFATSMGSFTCRLDYANSPKAVANFIGLATGQRAWLDGTSGAVRTNAFYDGLTFHRVIDGFMIQSGSPNSQGNDGPGYAFIDEFNTPARFSGTGVLAMANSGPDSNGAQFFITVAATPWLNGIHTIFGNLTGGTNVVLAISKVAVNASSKPLTNVVIESVKIRRVGTAAQAFDINGYQLPTVKRLPLALSCANQNTALTFTNRQYADNRLFSSRDLQNWSSSNLGIELTAPSTNRVYWSNDVPARFFSFAQIQYASSTLAPRNLLGRKLTFTISSQTPATLIVINFDNQYGGTYTLNGGSPGTLLSYTYEQQPYRGQLWPVYFSGLVPMTLTFSFRSATFSGTAYPDNGPSFGVSGTFSLN